MANRKLFFAAGLIAGGISVGTLNAITEAHAKAKQERVHVTTEYDSTNAALQVIKGHVKTAQCGIAETQENMPAGSCTVTPGSNTAIYWGDDADPDSKTRVASGFLFSGQLAWDETQAP